MFSDFIFSNFALSTKDKRRVLLQSSLLRLAHGPEHIGYSWETLQLRNSRDSPNQGRYVRLYDSNPKESRLKNIPEETKL